jgi:hypothetical protein
MDTKINNTETTHSVAVVNAVNLWETTRSWVQNGIKDMTREELLSRLGPDRNHAWWLFGHIVVCTDIAKYLQSSSHRIVPEAWEQHFAMRTKPSDSGEGYPDKEALIAQFHANIDATIAATKQMSDANFADAPATELPAPLNKYFLNKRDVISGFTTHAAYHSGQIAIIRKMLGR